MLQVAGGIFLFFAILWALPLVLALLGWFINFIATMWPILLAGLMLAIMVGVVKGLKDS